MKSNHLNKNVSTNEKELEKKKGLSKLKHAAKIVQYIIHNNSDIH